MIGPSNLELSRSYAVKALHSIDKACEQLVLAGMPENARELRRSYHHLAVWTEKGGWFDQLEDDQ